MSKREKKPRPPTKAQLQQMLENQRLAAQKLQARVTELEAPRADPLGPIQSALKGMRTRGKLLLLTPAAVMVLPITELKRHPAANAAEYQEPQWNWNTNSDKDREDREALTIITRLSQ